jgi:hypothetical protein
MQNKNMIEVFSGADELLEMLVEESRRHRNQIGDKRYQFYFSGNLTISNEASREKLAPIVDQLLLFTGKKRTPKTYHKYRQNIEIIILNLAKCILNRQWCLIPLDNNAYGKPPYKNTQLSARYVKEIVNTLDRLGKVEIIKGAKYQNQPTRTAIQPTESFSTNCLAAYLQTEDSIIPPYATWSKTKNKNKLSKEEMNYRGFIDEEYIPNESDVKQLERDEKDLGIINQFLSAHSWACKSSITRKYSPRVGLSGRLYCAFQSLPQRRIPIRSNTLIDGKPIVEVDIKSSHMRMAVAQCHNEKLDREFYYIVEKETGVFQSKAKLFTMLSLSSITRKQALGAFKSHKSGGRELDFEILEGYVFDRFDRIPYYEGWSLQLMNWEGEILKQVMLEGVKNNIAVLPIHDAVAVQAEHKQWAETTLKKCWNEFMRYEGCLVD